MNKVAAWFTPTRREQIQLFLGSLAPLAIFVGFGTDGIWEQILIITGATMQFAASLLSLVNVKVTDWATKGWAIVRGSIYGLATVVSPALVLLGFYSDEVNTSVLMGLSLGLSSLSSLIAIFANGKQQQALEG